MQRIELAMPLFPDEIELRLPPGYRLPPLKEAYEGRTPHEENERRFSRLCRDAYAILELPESVDSLRFNCKGYAAGFRDKILKSQPTVEAEARYFFEHFGYAPHADSGPEPLLEKVAIYAKGDVPLHYARQAPGGRWVSKIGPYELIEHELEGLTGDRETEYGRVALILARPANIRAGA